LGLLICQLRLSLRGGLNALRTIFMSHRIIYRAARYRALLRQGRCAALGLRLALNRYTNGWTALRITYLLLRIWPRHHVLRAARDTIQIMLEARAALLRGLDTRVAHKALSRRRHLLLTHLRARGLTCLRLPRLRGRMTCRGAVFILL
jgi:hypothetical protein